ncbi:MAG: hypothetical protein WCK82_14870 [Bacteroidota bacterium]
MENSNTQETDINNLIAKFKDQTPITVLIQDLKQTSNLVKSDYQKDIILKIVEVLKESYAERERNVMTKFAFDFYAELSRQMNVPENLITENINIAEVYFDEKFNRDENQDV